MNTQIFIPKMQCQRCGHRWYLRREELPAICPKCKSPYWALPQVAELEKIRSVLREISGQDVKVRCRKARDCEFVSGPWRLVYNFARQPGHVTPLFELMRGNIVKHYESLQELQAELGHDII